MVPQGGVGDRHLVTVPQGVVGDRLTWGGERQRGGGYFLLLIPTFCLQLQPNAVCFAVIFSHG